ALTARSSQPSATHARANARRVSHAKAANKLNSKPTTPKRVCPSPLEEKGKRALFKLCLDTLRLSSRPLRRERGHPCPPKLAKQASNSPSSLKHELRRAILFAPVGAQGGQGCPRSRQRVAQPGKE